MEKKIKNIAIDTLKHWQRYLWWKKLQVSQWMLFISLSYVRKNSIFLKDEKIKAF